MEIRYSCNQRDFKRYTTEEIRQEFLIENLYVPDEVVSVYSHVDRMITLGCMPVREVVPLEKGLDVYAALGVDFFLERRELGLFNLGGSGVVLGGSVVKHQALKGVNPGQPQSRQAVDSLAQLHQPFPGNPGALGPCVHLQADTVLASTAAWESLWAPSQLSTAKISRSTWRCRANARRIRNSPTMG